MKKQIIVIGGGASGLVAAIYAARNLRGQVTILEHNDRIGKKILVTGNGKCNLTNHKMGPEYYRGDNPKFIKEVLASYSEQDAIHFFEELGLCVSERNGYVYPTSGQASSVAEVLAMEVRRLGITVKTGVHVRAAQYDERQAVFTIRTAEAVYHADALVLAAGSRAASKQGSDGSGYELAKSFGHHIIPVVPALLQIRTEGRFLKEWAGVRLEGRVTLSFRKTMEDVSDTGELLLTDYGISGIPVFQVSRFAAKAMEEWIPVTAYLDFLPKMRKTTLITHMMWRFSKPDNKTAEEAMIGLINKKMIPILLREAGIDRREPAKKVSGDAIAALVSLLKKFPLKVTGVNDFEHAQVCAGGVDTRQVNPHTMMSHMVNNLYLTGELLDADGICGGYNLQWAWSTGAIAGKSIAKS